LHFAYPHGKKLKKTMMKTEIVDVIAKAHFFDDRIGAVGRKQRLRIPKALAEYLASIDLVDLVNPSVVATQEIPSTGLVESGVEQPSAALPQAQALPEPTAPIFRRGRKKTAG